MAEIVLLEFSQDGSPSPAVHDVGAVLLKLSGRSQLENLACHVHRLERVLSC